MSKPESADLDSDSVYENYDYDEKTELICPTYLTTDEVYQICKYNNENKHHVVCGMLWGQGVGAHGRKTTVVLMMKGNNKLGFVNGVYRESLDKCMKISSVLVPNLTDMIKRKLRLGKNFNDWVEMYNEVTVLSVPCPRATMFYHIYALKLSLVQAEIIENSRKSMIRVPVGNLDELARFLHQQQFHENNRELLMVALKQIGVLDSEDILKVSDAIIEMDNATDTVLVPAASASTEREINSIRNSPCL